MILSCFSQIKTMIKFKEPYIAINEPLLNLKPGQTELLVFGTNELFATIHKNLEIIHNHHMINITTNITTKYLGVELTSSLNLNSQQKLEKAIISTKKHYIASDAF